MLKTSFSLWYTQGFIFKLELITMSNLPITVTKYLENFVLETLRKGRSSNWYSGLITQHVQNNSHGKSDETHIIYHVLLLVALNAEQLPIYVHLYRRPTNLSASNPAYNITGLFCCRQVCNFYCCTSSVVNCQPTKYSLTEKVVPGTSTVSISRTLYSKNLMNMYKVTFIKSLLTFPDWCVQQNFYSKHTSWENENTTRAVHLSLVLYLLGMLMLLDIF